MARLRQSNSRDNHRTAASGSLIEPTAEPLQALWAPDAHGRLAGRKRGPAWSRGHDGKGDSVSRIGSWIEDEAAPAVIPELPDWTRIRGVNAVIWTARGLSSRVRKSRRQNGRWLNIFSASKVESAREPSGMCVARPVRSILDTVAELRSNSGGHTENVQGLASNPLAGSS
jgi:hypothetical protein